MNEEAIRARIRTFGPYGATREGEIVQLVRDKVREALDAYKARVLKVAQDAQANEGWCDEGLAQALRELDIEPPKRDFVVGVEVTAYQTVFVTVQAGTKADAASQAAALSASDLMDRASADGWNHETHDVGEVSS